MYTWIFFFALIVGSGKKKAKQYNKKGSVYLWIFSFKKKILEKGNIN